jgi:hypothetical protein
MPRLPILRLVEHQIMRFNFDSRLVRATVTANTEIVPTALPPPLVSCPVMFVTKNESTSFKIRLI